MDKLAPMKSGTIVLRPNAPWYNEDITKQKRIRRRFERKWRSSTLESDKENYLRQCSVVNTMLYKAKENYYSTIVKDNAKDSKLLSTGVMPDDQKTALLKPLLKKPNADFEQFSSFRPVSNLKFLSKLIEKSACLQLNKYLIG